MPETGLKVDDLSLTRGGRTVFSKLGFTLAPGQALEVRGANGAGKSSLLMALAGLLAPTRGKIVWTGGDAESESGTLLHYLGHMAAVKSGLTLKENLGFWIDVLGGAREVVTPALMAAGLGAIADLDAGVLSAGQARRLALARLIAVPRPVWLLDEPTGALDAEGANLVGSLIAGHVAGGGIAVIATHLDIDYGSGISPKRLVLERGA